MEHQKLSNVLGGFRQGASKATGLLENATQGDILGMGRTAFSGTGTGLKDGIQQRANAVKMQSNEHLAELVRTSPPPAMQTQAGQTTGVELDPSQPQRRT